MPTFWVTEKKHCIHTQNLFRNFIKSNRNLYFVRLVPNQSEKSDPSFLPLIPVRHEWEERRIIIIRPYLFKGSAIDPHKSEQALIHRTVGDDLKGQTTKARAVQSTGFGQRLLRT